MFDASIHTETELILRLKKGENAAYDYLYDHYGATLYGVILKIVRKETTAQDVLQEVFIKIFQKIGQYDETKGRLFTWMINITRNTAIDKIRSKEFKDSVRIHSFDHDVNQNSISTLPYIDHIGLEKVIDTLDASHRIIIEMAYFKGYSQNEIAKELSLPLGTVKTRVRSALIQLRKVLNIS